MEQGPSRELLERNYLEGPSPLFRELSSPFRLPGKREGVPISSPAF